MASYPISMILKLEERPEIERWVAVMSLGICAAIAKKGMSIEAAESRLFNPRTLAQLEKLGMTQNVLDILHLGTELEDIQSLAPERLRDSLEEIQAKALEILSQLEQSVLSTSQIEQWIQV
jgi:Protein of unknown function (DUF3969)